MKKDRENMTLEISHLTGGYSGIPVIKDVNLAIASGEAIGLIGLNGAGKSTTIKHLLGLLRPQAGKITLNGINLAEKPAEFKKLVAYIPETPVIYPELTLKEHLELTILAYQLDPDKAWEKAKELLTMFRLADKLDWLPVHFSKGMQQKVMIVAAFLTDAQLLVIDEPFTGLDPLAVANFIGLIKEAQESGKEILMTTHVLADAQKAIKTYAILNQGTIEFTGSLDEIRDHYGLEASDSFDKLYQLLYQEQKNA
ncbi:ABC transporter ATP-binding protein [Lactobacillus delbrueckii]|uniref:ABC transporter ATP-binding protein n=3 Tax=Lactobacillus delbrueckii TaxID=1584 RepID=A0ABD0AFI6_9LACO|nr:ABC transporter ATP-binding protein [Lactobacillus delbrueckii]GHN33844.1 ABC transporter ATP-binding protein [Lactobacillus delbrueckii]GHN41542.1 ABC transporter ATP-binding protein [Lactobacillus delbrueckii]